MPRVKDPNKPKRGFMDYKRHYNPEVEGYGSPDEWRGAFEFRLGLDAAREAVGNDTPRGILGLGLKATWDEVKAAWRKLVRKFHPDNQETGNPTMFRKVQGAYEILDDAHKKGRV